MANRLLAEKLGVDVERLDTWVGEGCPETYDEAAAWLIEKGYAEAVDPDDYVETFVEIAGLLECGKSTASSYTLRESFPAGPPWNKDEVKAWGRAHQIRYKNATPPDPTPAKPAEPKKQTQAAKNRDRLAAVKLERERLKLERERAEVLPIDEVVAEMTRQHALATQKLKRLVPMLVQILPADTDARVIDDFRARANRIIDDARDDIATAFRGQIDEQA